MKTQEKKQTEEDFRNNCRFEVSLRYELFYSLNALLDPKSRIHSAWRKSARHSLGREFDKLMTEIGNAWEIWPVMAALLPGALHDPSFEEIQEKLQSLTIETYKEKILRGLIHSEEAIGPLLSKKTSLQEAIAKVPKLKREWIGHIGLYPYDPKSPLVLALEKLIKNPKEFREITLRILKIYWQNCFKATWERLLPQLRQSQATRERLFHSCTFAEFSKQALLRIEVDEGKGEIHALRGGYRVLFQDIEACYFLPSAFNDRRFWSAFNDDKSETTIYFPSFDPTIALDLRIAGKETDMTAPDLDPALVFKALGDSTRFAIATILARNPTNSVELAKMLSVSKPTISHHVHVLREAGLIRENYANGSVELQLNRSILERLSEAAITRLFEDRNPMHLIRTRGGALT